MKNKFILIIATILCINLAYAEFEIYDNISATNYNLTIDNIYANYYHGNGSFISGIFGSQISNNLNWVNYTKLSEFTNDLGIGNWTLDKPNYYTKTDILNFNYWNDTFASFNKTYADTLYYGINNPYGYYNYSSYMTASSVLSPDTYQIGSGITWIESPTRYAELNITCDGLNCSYGAFAVRLITSTNQVTYCNISAGSITILDNTHNVLYVDSNCQIQKISVQDYINSLISPGGIAEFGNVIAYDEETELSSGSETENKRNIKKDKLSLVSSTTHLTYINGMDIELNTFKHFNITSGQYVYLNDAETTSKVDTRINEIEVVSHISSTEWEHIDQSDGLNITYCDTGSSTEICTNTNRYRQVLIFMVGYNNSVDKTSLHQLLPSQNNYYNNLEECMSATPSFILPDYYKYSARLLYAYCTRPSDTYWVSTNFIDLRGYTTQILPTTIDTSIFLTKDGTNIAQYLTINNTQFDTNAISAYGNVEEYFQMLIQNYNSNASGDFAVASNFGNSSYYMVDLGITGTTFNDITYSNVTPANTSYLISSDTPLVIGAGTPKWISFFLDSFTLPNWIMNLTSTKIEMFKDVEIEANLNVSNKLIIKDNVTEGYMETYMYNGTIYQIIY